MAFYYEEVTEILAGKQLTKVFEETLVLILIVEVRRLASHGSRNGRDVIYEVVSGASAGAIAATIMSLLDVIKTRLQVYGLLPNAPGNKGEFNSFMLLLTYYSCLQSILTPLQWEQPFYPPQIALL